MRIASVRGTPSAQGTPLQVGQRYDSGAALQLADTDEVALDIAQSGRVSIQGPAALSLGGDAPAQLFATGGVITVIVPPAGDGKLVAQRLVTPRHTLLLRPGTTAVIAIDRRGQTLAHVLTGAAEVVASSTDENATLLRIDPSAAQRFDDKGVTALPPGADVTAAVAKARLFVKAARPTGAGGAQTVAAAIEKLEATLQALNAELEQGRAIAELHKRAITAGDVAQRSAQQRALATHGQRSYRIRRAILAAWEQVQLAALRADPAQPSGISPDLRSRVVAVLPR